VVSVGYKGLGIVLFGNLRMGHIWQHHFSGSSMEPCTGLWPMVLTR
jgi:hypothetical protein